jgi:hypothetical protein
MWRLRQNQPAFELVDGPMAGRKFIHGEAYEQVPAGSEHQFEAITEDRDRPSGQTADPAKKNRKVEQSSDEERTDVEQPR